jgi:peptide/nickel transport system substrate-binding protein
MKKVLMGGVASGVMLAMSGAVAAQSTLRVVMHSDLKVVDPIWTTAYISRNYGYMVYDTLFALDDQLNVQPQMVGSYQVSDDNLTYTFTLRDGLRWHDGQPVTAEDAIASIERWGEKDSMGQLLLGSVVGMKAQGDKTFEMTLKEPYGLVLLSLAKPSSNVPFIMPKRIAETPSSEQISEYVGSGPFVFARHEWAGTKAVFTKFAGYKPRTEPPSWAAGGKLAKVDRVEWVWIPDMQTAVNALIDGEIDVIETPAHDLLPILEADESVTLFDYNPLGNQYMFRMNWLHPPFDNQKVRQAALAALNQEDFLKAVIGDSRYYKTCPAMFVCDTPFATDAGTEDLMKSDFERSKQLLAEAGYDGTPVVLMHSLKVLANLAPVAKQFLEKGGFTVDMQSMDWQTLVSRRGKREPPSEGGWNAFLTSFVAADVLNPISTAALNASCEKAWFGWPCDEQLEQLRLAFAKETDPAKQTELAHQIQTRALEVGTHAYLGQWYQPIAHRDNVSGFLRGPAPFFWNVSKSAPASISFEESILTIDAADDRFEFQVEMAVSPAQISRGLMFRESLQEDRGMLFDFGQPPQRATMWMRDTYVPLDMLFIDAHGRITQIAADTHPLSDTVIASREPVRAVLELRGGVSAKLGIKPGDRVIHPLFTEP